MSNFSQALTAAAGRNHELLDILSQTDYAAPSLRQNKAYVSDLQNQIARTDKELTKLHAVTEDERKDHVKYRDSTVKRFAYKLGGQKGKTKFASKQEKEEREFLEAWQREREAKDARSQLSTALDYAETDGQRIEADVARHEQAQNDLDALYASIFTGPTPEVPGEDYAEQALQQARGAFDHAQSQSRTEQCALQALKSADQEFGQATRDINEALSASTYDMFGGGTFADMMERDALSRAQAGITQGARHLREAQRAQPAIQSLSGVQIDHGHFVSDVLFDNIFSDMAQHERIKSSASQLHLATQQLADQLSQQRSRQQAAEWQLKSATETLENSRQELQRIRAQAFEQYANAGGPPPSYQA